MNRLERLHAIGERLRRVAPDTVSAARLAEEFDVSRRTIERDLDTLRRAGATLWGQPGPGGGVAILDGPRRLVALTDAEIAALVVTAHAAGDAPFASRARRAAETLVGHASAEVQAGVDETRRAVLLVASGRTDRRVRRTVERAVAERRRMSMEYRDRDDILTKRRVDPVGFLGNGGVWSLVAHCHLRHAGRLFRLDRISRATLTAESADRHDLRAVLGDTPFAVHPPR